LAFPAQTSNIYLVQPSWRALASGCIYGGIFELKVGDIRCADITDVVFECYQVPRHRKFEVIIKNGIFFNIDAALQKQK
jgi:hypothetical protein